MKSTSVVVRLFMVITLVFIAFVSIAFVIQIRSFETYYYELKISDIDDKFSAFEDLYENAKWNENLLEQNIQYFENRNDVKIALVDYHYGIVNEQKYKIYILDPNGQVYAVELNDMFSEEDYQDLSIKRGDDIVVYGYFWGDDLRNISLQQLEINGVLVFDGVDSKVRGKINLDRVEGSVLSMNLPDEQDLKYGLYNQSFSSVIDMYYFQEELLDIQDDSFVFSDSLTDRKYIVKVYPLNDIDVKSIFVMTDQQPIIEAAAALKAFYPSLVAGVFIIGGIMMFFLIFSISNPLYDIERKAEKLVSFDFTDYLDIKHNDEIGRLSKSLNQLSYNLENSLIALNDANNKLVEDMAKDREIEALRKEFIRNVSHDFKTPLGIIRAYTEGLSDGVLDQDDVSYYAGIILDEVDTVESLVDDMLELSKLQTGAYGLEIEDFHLNALIENLIERNRVIAESKSIDMVFDGTTFDLIFGDYRKLSRVIQNFIANAIEYGNENSQIKVVTRVIERKIRFEIYNECPLIDEAQLDRIWTKFYRVDTARTKSGSGSGLGLAIVKEILSLHQGDYGVANTENGVVFYFEMDKYVNQIV